jgi:hypothetical protein
MDVIMKNVNYVINIKYSLNLLMLILYFHSIIIDIIIILITLRLTNPKIHSELFITYNLLFTTQHIKFLINYKTINHHNHHSNKEIEYLTLIILIISKIHLILIIIIKNQYSFLT